MTNWICTDPDSMQYQKRVSKHMYRMMEMVGPYPNGKYLVAKGMLDVRDYVEDKKMLESYFDLPKNELDNEALLVEYGFEHDWLDFLEGSEFMDEYEAKRFIWDTVEQDFINMVNMYKSLGYRMVAFEKECQGGWVMAFDTHGVDATTLPKEAFDVPCQKEWCKLYGWGSVLDDDVLIYDETDDPIFLIDSYDYMADFPVMQLADYKEG